ncbi:DUF4388 domain-containing protein [Actinomarinicola tropica]|uniref:DUF4388 domain-containing protein n=1 Tax=Actinomarinicola tropica TaxID=2789776 RepID=A0A5Q2REX4_9ACTN|nr:DUF4388 domain-containing protein [Actinomarinicola tropica]QGG95369.1 DUF4388 domain-containing protein [Actinomarinicola tropica]
MSSSTSGLEGRLDEVAFADVLRLLRASRQDGTLHLDAETSHVAVVVGPEVVRIATTGLEGLRAAVVGSGVVDPGAWDALVEAGDESPGAALEQLVSSGADPDRLRARLYDHTVNTLFELLLPSTARFEFHAGRSHPFAADPGYPFEDVLDDVRHRVDEWRTIAASIPSTSVVLRRAPRLPLTSGPITLNHEEFELLGLLDGRRDVAELVQLLGMSAFRVMTTLHRLITLGAVLPPDRDA